MRQLTNFEASAVSGGERHDVVVVDPVAMIQTLFLMVTYGDKASFSNGMVVTGMLGGAVVGGMAGFGAAGAAGAIGVGGAILGGMGGTVVGGIAGKAGGAFCTGVYSQLMG